MSLLRALLALSVALVLQASLGRLWPEVQRIVDLDLLLVPVVWYGIARSQRWAMLIGCAAGLLQDAWFQVGPFGMNGFKKTLIGWVLGGLGSRVNLNQTSGRLAAGALVALADELLELALRRLMDQPSLFAGPLELVAKALATGLLVALAGRIVERRSDGRAVPYPV